MVSKIPKARFRIQVYDMQDHKAPSTSFSDGDGATADSLMAMIEDSIEKKEYRKFADAKKSATKKV